MRTLILFLFTTLGFYCFSQNEQFVSLELAGSGGFGSINYEKTFLKKEKFSANWRAGFSLTPLDKNNGTVLIFPLMAHGIIGKKAHKLDLGIGQSVSITTKGSPFVLMPLSAGYRYQNPNKKHYLRFSYTPIASYLLNFQWQHWAGFTYGLKL